MTRYVDTNILMRLITNDVPELAQIAIEEVAQSGRGELVIFDAVLVELFFILEANPQYRFTRDKTTHAFEEIILASLQFKISEAARSAFDLFARNRKLDFVDCLLATAAKGRRAHLMTFDKDLLKALV